MPETVSPASLKTEAPASDPTDLTVATSGKFKLPTWKPVTHRSAKNTYVTKDTKVSTSDVPETELTVTADVETGQIIVAPGPSQQESQVTQNSKQHGGQVVRQVPLLLPEFTDSGGLENKQRIFIGYPTEKRYSQLKFRSDKNSGVVNSLIIQHGVRIMWNDRFCALLRLKTVDNKQTYEGLLACFKTPCLIPKNLSKSLLNALNINCKKLIKMEYLSLCIDNFHVRLRALLFPYMNMLVKTTILSGGLVMFYEEQNYLILKETDVDTLARYFVDD